MSDSLKFTGGDNFSGEDFPEGADFGLSELASLPWLLEISWRLCPEEYSFTSTTFTRCCVETDDPIERLPQRE